MTETSNLLFSQPIMKRKHSIAVLNAILVSTALLSGCSVERETTNGELAFKLAILETKALLPFCEDHLLSSDWESDAPLSYLEPLNRCVHQYATFKETKEAIENSNYNFYGSEFALPRDVRDMSAFSYLDENYPANIEKYLRLTTEGADVADDFEGQLHDAKRGDAVSQYLVAEAYASGKNERGARTEEDNEQAYRWYQDSAIQGYAPALQVLGWMYKTGSGLKRDTLKAHDIYMEAAKLGELGAMHEVASAYNLGWTDVPKNLVEAKVWYSVLDSLGGGDDYYIPEIELPQENEIEAQRRVTELLQEVRSSKKEHCLKFHKKDCPT